MCCFGGPVGGCALSFFSLCRSQFSAGSRGNKAMQLINWSAGERQLPLPFYGVVLCPQWLHMTTYPASDHRLARASFSGRVMHGSRSTWPRFLGLAVRLRHCRRPVRVLGTGTVQSTEETEKKCMRARNKATVVVYFVTAHCSNPEETTIGRPPTTPWRPSSRSVGSWKASEWCVSESENENETAAGQTPSQPALPSSRKPL